MAHDTELADRPAHTEKEIEITPEMIEVCKEWLYTYDGETSDADLLAGRMLRAILAIPTRPEKLADICYDRHGGD